MKSTSNSPLTIKDGCLKWKFRERSQEDSQQTFQLSYLGNMAAWFNLRVCRAGAGKVYNLGEWVRPEKTIALKF